MMSTLGKRFQASRTWVGSPDGSHRVVRVQDGVWSATNEIDARIKQLESRLDKAETLLDSVGLIFEKTELAQEHAQRGRRASLVLAAASTIVGLAVVFARRQDSP